MHCKIREIGHFQRCFSRFSGYFNLWRLCPKNSANRGLPPPPGSARPNPNMGAPDPETFISRVFCAQRPSETMVSDHVSEGARPWGRGRSGDCEKQNLKRFSGHSFRESFCESGEGVRLPRERADLWGSPGNFRGSPGNFRGSLGNFQGTPGLLLSSTVRELPGKSPKNFRGSLGNFRGSPGTSQKLGVA